MRDLCDRVSGAQSHNVHKVVGFEPFAPAALAFRIAVTAAALARPHAPSQAGLSGGQALLVAVLVVALWGVLLVTKLVLGFLLKLIATAYLHHYDAKRAAAAARSGSRALGTRRVTLVSSALQAAAAGGGKKEE